MTSQKLHKQGHKLRIREDPPPDVPGGLADSRYTSNWRKPWPQGADDGNGDGEVLDQFNKPDKKKEKEKKEEKYPWEYDKEVLDVANSIQKGEEIKKDSLSYDSVATFKGKNWIFDFADGKHKTKSEPNKGVAGWDYDTKYNGEWKKGGKNDY